jgi:hypothetical protein
MKSRTIKAAGQQAVPSPKIPWIIFLFLSAVFFLKQHDWFFSLKAGFGFSTPVDEMTAVISQGNLLARIGSFSLGVYAVTSLIRKRQYHMSINGSLGWLILFFLMWIFLSLAWSDDPSRTFGSLSYGFFSAPLVICLLVLWLNSCLVRFILLREDTVLPEPCIPTIRV